MQQLMEGSRSKLLPPDLEWGFPGDIHNWSCIWKSSVMGLISHAHRGWPKGNVFHLQIASSCRNAAKTSEDIACYPWEMGEVQMPIVVGCISSGG